MKRLVLLVCIVLSALPSIGQKKDSLLQLLQQPIAIEQKIAAYQTVIVTLWLNHPDSAMIFAREAVRLATAEKNIHSQAVAIRLLGGVHLYKGAYDSALICSQLAYQYSVQSNDSILISSAYNNIGFTQYHFGDYSSALENLLIALDMKRRLRSNYGLAQTHNNIGLVYTKLKDFSKARLYFEQALNTAQKLNDGNQKLYSSNNIGFTYLYESNYAEACVYFLQSLDIAGKLNNNNWHATAYSGLAQTKLRQGETNEALILFKKSLLLRKEIGDLNGISEVYYFISQIDAKQKQYDSAFNKLRASQKLATKIRSKTRKLENYAWYKSLFIIAKRYDSALYYQDLFIQLKDSLFNENLARELADIHLKAVQEKNKSQLDARDSQLRQRATIIVFLASIAFLILVSGIIFYYNYRKKRKLSKALLLKNKEIINQSEEIVLQQEALLLSHQELEKAQSHIQQQNKLLIDLNNKLQATVDTRTKELELVNHELKYASLELDNFIYRSSHDIRGPLVRLLGVCEVALLDVSDTKAREYFTFLHTTARHLNEIFDKLKSVSEINSVNLQNATVVDFSNLIKGVKARLEKMESYQDIKFIEKIDITNDYIADEFLMETIFYGMMENAVRFQKKSIEKNKFVKIRIKERKGKVIITFLDNGIGISESHADHLFEMFTVAARENKNIGLGLYIVKQAVEKQKGEVGLAKSKSGYTKFRVVLPFLS